MPDYLLHLNGRETLLAARGDPSLLEALQGPLGLRRTQAGCGMGLCGACTVLVDGKAHRACSLRLSELDGHRIRTIEGLLEQEPAHPVLTAWRDAGLPEPGACLCPSGRIMALAGLWEDGLLNPDTAGAVAEESICECGRDEATRGVERRLSADG
jgi:isoquinoline 1-oxidoreductase alpha subunit